MKNQWRAILLIYHPLKKLYLLNMFFCQYPAPFSFPNLLEKLAHLMNLYPLKTLEDWMAKGGGKSV